MKLGARGPAVVSLAMPLPWMADGFVLSVRRVEAADVPASADAKDACIPLFEALSWLDAINETHKPPSLIGDQDVRALRFVRNRQHHHKAAPVRRGQGVDQWIWHKAETFPEPQRGAYRAGPKGQIAYERDLDRKGQRLYSRLLADKPVREVLRRLEQKVTALL